MTAPLYSDRCWAVDEETGQQCQKRILTGAEVHAGPCAFVLDDIWLGLAGGHFLGCPCLSFEEAHPKEKSA